MTADEYNTCVDLFADRVFRFILKNIKNEADAQDVVQNAFEILWKQYEKVAFSKARSFLFSVAYHNMIDQIRKMKRISHVAAVPEYAFTAMPSPDLSDVLRQGLDRLPDIQRSAILLRDYEGYSYKEIAKITELSESQVKVYIFRGRKKLQQYLVSIDKVV